MTRSGLQRLRFCVCHLHHERATNAPASVRQFFKTVLQQVHHFKVDVIAGVATAAYKYYKRQEYQDLHNSSVAIMLREMQREVSMCILLPIIILLSFTQQMILIVALRLFSHGESQSAPESCENVGKMCVTKQTTTRRNRRKIIRVCEEAKASSERRPSGLSKPRGR